MKQPFEVSEGGQDMLLLIYPPQLILELARVIDSNKKRKGRLPEVMHTPIRGSFIPELTTDESFDRGLKRMLFGD